MMRARFCFLTFVVLSSALVPSSAVSQTSVVFAERRADLEAQARAADSANRPDEASALRRRLHDGDFEVGDRVFLVFESPDQARIVPGMADRDTLLVQSGRRLVLPPPIGDVELTGVLYAEVTDTLNARIAQYYKSIKVRATPLIRLSVTGAVLHPGYYYFASDSPLSDLVMRTGGQTGNADLRKAQLRRANTVLWKGDDVQAALAGGATVQSLGLRAGDELNVGERRQKGWIMPAVQLGVTVATLIFTFTRLK
jgi:protein involved in polysaccharide export with SLBB domain